MRIIAFTYLLLFFASSAQSKDTFERSTSLMGSHFEITVIADNEQLGNQYIDLAIEEIRRIERLISSWDSSSETTKIIENAGANPTRVSNELYGLIERSIQISKITNGAFDISYASMDRIWKFDGSMTQMPSKEAIEKSISKVGFQNIKLDKANQTVYLKKEGMKIGFGAIGKGYAADKAKQLLIEKGVSGGIINASGDLTTWGKQTNGKLWTIGITNPLNENKIFSWFPLDNKAVVTSGNYEKYVELEGKRYSHIIDPRSGYPSSGLVSVTVFAPKAELADALATSIFVMGKEVGIHFINQLKGIECILVDDKGNISHSENIDLNKTKQD